nr:hypothetical protein [Tanacetum cinerariifolium]
IDGLDRNNETVAKYLQEYNQFAALLLIERRIELISDLVKYQDNYAKVLKYQTQQRKPLTRKQQREFYTSVLRNQSRWKAKHFKDIRGKFDPVWKQFQDFIPIGSKEEAERFKRKAVPVEEIYVEALQVKHPIIDWKVHTEGQRSYWKLIRLRGSSASYQFFVDMLKHLDREDLNQLWELVKETLSISQPQNSMHAPVEWKLYDTCGVHHVTSKDKEIFMLVEKDYPLRKGLAIVMISYKLQVENYSQMANDLILKIYMIAITIYGSDFLILLAYAPSMPQRLSLSLFMACDDSDGQDCHPEEAFNAPTNPVQFTIYGSDLLIFLTYAPSMPPLLSLSYPWRATIVTVTVNEAVMN